MQPPLGKFPATFTGTLPCADCPGIEYHLDLFPAGYYFMRMTYLERKTHFDEIGRWSLSGDRTKLVLGAGPGRKTQLAIREQNTLRMLDGNGNEIPTKLNYDIRRAASFSPIEPRLKLQGNYTYADNGGVFAECLTGKPWNVVEDKNGAAMREMYLRARSAPGAALFATVDAKLTARRKDGGNGFEQTLTVEGQFHFSPGGACSSK